MLLTHKSHISTTLLRIQQPTGASQHAPCTHKAAPQSIQGPFEILTLHDKLPVKGVWLKVLACIWLTVLSHSSAMPPKAKGKAKAKAKAKAQPKRPYRSRISVPAPAPLRERNEQRQNDLRGRPGS